MRIRLRADVPVGCYLSGGLDSCAVLGLAARHHPEPIRAFTLTFDRAEYDEEEIAREMAAKAGAEFCPIPIRQDDLADHFADAIAQSETLCFNAHGVAKYLLSRAVRDAGYKVVLTGEGSDEILGGYAHFRRDMLLYNREGQDPAVVADLLDELDKAQSCVPWIAAAGRRGRAARHGQAAARLCAFVDRDLLRPLREDAGLVGRRSSREVRTARELPRLLQRHRRARPTQRDEIRCNQSLYLVGKDRAALLHPDHAGRPHGDGTFDRGTRALPRSPCGRSDPFAAGVPEDPRHDREVRASRSSPRRHQRHRLPPAEAPVSQPARDTESQRIG